jgi:mannose-6-phosphate isomerase-like protein (cupin superfamily)
LELLSRKNVNKPFRRVVTGHDKQGRAIIQSDSAPERVKTLSGGGPTFYEIWNTRETPAKLDKNSGEPPEEGIILTPPRSGTRIRVLDIPPETEEFAQIDSAQAQALFAEIGARGASTNAGIARHPHMHRTETIDYGIVLDGEITLLVDIGEVTVRAGDIVVQRGTNHGWANRSRNVCRIAFILIDGMFTDGLG